MGVVPICVGKFLSLCLYSRCACVKFVYNVGVQINTPLLGREYYFFIIFFSNVHLIRGPSASQDRGFCGVFYEYKKNQEVWFMRPYWKDNGYLWT